MNRRDFLKIGLAGGALPLFDTFNMSAVAATFSDWAAQPIYAMISDERFESGRIFGRQAELSRLEHWPIDGDITPVWRKLHQMWRSHPVAIAGMTAREPFFCIEQLARDHGMRVSLRILHQAESNSVTRHIIQAPAFQLDSIVGLVDGVGNWAERIGRLTAQCSWRHCTTAGHSQEAFSPPETEQLSTDLISWVIAPAVAVV